MADLEQLLQDLEPDLENIRGTNCADVTALQVIATKTMQMLQICGETALGPLQEKVLPLMVSTPGEVTHNAKVLMMEIMKEYHHLEATDLSKEGSTKQYSNFLILLAQQCSHAMVSCIAPLFNHLNGDNYTMRNAVLTVIAELVINVFSQECLPQEQRVKRDSLLDYLLGHICDVNAFVRKKSISLWMDLFDRDAIPLSYQRDLFPRICRRIQDKSAIVRKEALKFMSGYLRRNPYHGSLALIEEKLKKCEESLKIIKGEAEKDAKEKAEEAWDEMVEEVRTVTNALIQNKMAAAQEEDQVGYIYCIVALENPVTI